MTRHSHEVSDALAALDRLYSEGVLAHGASPRSVGWKDAASQRLRFDKLVQLLPASVEPISVNDLGCGYGSLFGYLDALSGVDLARYHGYDISEPMLDRARRETDDRACFIQATEMTHVADFAFASGTFNVKDQSTDAAWEAYVYDCVRGLARSSRRGFAFNLLTTFVDYREDHLFYGDPAAFFAFCKREISPYVALLHDYPLYEWTMLVHHP